MTTIGAETKSGFHSALTAPGRSPEIPESADAYGWLIGSWKLDVFDYSAGPSAAPYRSEGEVHFGWVLKGRAVEDVWIMPQRTVYGVTARVWDPSIQAWRVTWINPVSGVRDELIGRWSGKDIVQIGKHSDGAPIRWIFSEITPDSFRWTGEVLEPDGKTWRLETEFRAKRGARSTT